MAHQHPSYFDPLGLSQAFVHRRLIGAAKGLVTGGVRGGVVGLLTTGGSEGRSGSSVVPTSRNQSSPGLMLGPVDVPAPVTAGLGDRARACQRKGLVIDASGRCASPAGFSGLGPGPGIFDPLGLDLGARARGLLDPVGSGVPVPMIGASATAPLRETQIVRRCGRGNVLAIDGLCYDRKLLRKDQRMWPPGRKPLLTGGDLNAISRAARAAGRMKTQQKRLQKLGLLPKPKTTQRRIAPVSHHHD